MVNFCKSSKCLIGKTAIVTGSNTGIGYETALEFAKRGCRVILACRNQEKAIQARDQIAALTGNENVLFKHLDLESLDSVREFAKNINSTEDRLDILVNNAGAANLPDRLTPDGLQLEMAVNYFSPFLLTNLLLGMRWTENKNFLIISLPDLLKQSAPSRVINVSSVLAKLISNLNLDELNKHTGDFNMYNKTKLCNIYFTQELARRLQGSGVTTYSLHPGVVHTDFQRFSNVLNYIASKCFKTAEEGAQTSIYLSLEDGIEEYNGQHFEDCKPVKPYCGARDEDKAKKLWEISERMVGLK
ncbi:adh short domain containing protein [Asbolus verrucosus]|uniref:Adh short domain containing protein n=1 Tax=Asbolus verrucosus TaxID=1661398 RepID=A0A482WBW6_ASBVE|nr:adh short domain containing protein [Asbolus verrucosus]